MLTFLFSIATINLSSFIDGLSNVESRINTTSKEVDFIINNKDTYFFYHTLSILKFAIFNNNNQIKNIKNGFRIPKNSIVKLFGKWDELLKNYNNTFLIGFYNGRNCDFIFYSSSANESFPLDFFPNQRKCIYHFYKNSVFSNLTQHDGKNRKTFSFFNKESIFQKKFDVKGVIKVNEKHPNILDDSLEENEVIDYGFTYSDGTPTLVLGVIVNVLGLLFYILFILVYATEGDICSSIKFAIKDKLDLYNLENNFYSDILQNIYKDDFKEKHES